jgi:hypothetical protein
MPKRRDMAELTDNAAKARLSRFIRECEAGWLFYSPLGTAYHITGNEAELLEHRGQRIIARCNRFVPQFDNIPIRLVQLAFATVFLTISLFVLFGLSTLPGTYIAFWMLLMAIFTYLLNPIIVMCVRNTILLAWQGSEARKLKRNGRGSVPKAIETRQRRYNVFRILFNIAFVVFLHQLVWSCVATRTELSQASLFALPISIIVMLLTALPARRVDATHRRRKWLE